MVHLLIIARGKGLIQRTNRCMVLKGDWGISVGKPQKTVRQMVIR